MREPLNPKVGKQILVLRGAELAKNWPSQSDKIAILASRETMQQLWAILNDLHDAGKTQ